jgi:hypothetical protein
MKNKIFNISLLIITFTLLVTSTSQVFAQQMVFQVIGGGYRFVGPTTIIFEPIEQSATETQISVKNIADPSNQPNYIEIEDQNGGAPFDVRISVTSPFTFNDPIPGDEIIYPFQIPLTNFFIQNINTHTTQEGRADGFAISEITFGQGVSLANERTLGSGTGQEPGKWRFTPEFKIEVPALTPPGTYSTTVVFTVI